MECVYYNKNKMYYIAIIIIGCVVGLSRLPSLDIDSGSGHEACSRKDKVNKYIYILLSCSIYIYIIVITIAKSIIIII